MTERQDATPQKSDWPLSRGWTIVLAILTVGIGLLVPLAIYFWRRGQRIRYSDGGEKIIDNTTDPYAQSDQPGGFTISPHTTRVIYLQHSYDATSHDLVQAAASLDLSANSYPYITCTTC